VNKLIHQFFFTLFTFFMNPFVIAFRRIIYSIPLKRLLVWLAVFAVLFASFSSATTINNSDTQIFWFLNDVSYSQVDLRDRFWVSNSDLVFCAFFQNPWTFNDWTTTYTLGSYQTYCTNNSTVIINPNWQYWATYFNKVWVDIFFPPYTSLECQTEYNLIPINSVDQNYCTTNNLCPVEDCPGGDLTPWVSNIYINDLFHPGAFNVIMNIPDEIDWDYAYTNSWQNFNVDIVWYNQDFEKIEWWINTNNYKPSSEDFTNIFTWWFSNFWWLLIATLFVILVFYFVKKMFK
jgi:hypothetical protein